MSNITSNELPMSMEMIEEDAEAQTQGTGRVEKFVIRFPEGLRNQLRQVSARNHRSMNSEIINVLEKHIQDTLFAPIEDLDEDGESRIAFTISERELNDKLQSLSPEKKEALLKLLD